MKKKRDIKASLLQQFISFFNKYRHAGIEAIGNPEDNIKAVVVRYHDREIELPPLLGWEDLFNKLTELHPPKTRPTVSDALACHSDPPARERRAGTPSKRQHGAS